jgi:hypothetical protein
MSSESDQYVVEAATTPQNNEALMKSKRWVYSTDSNSTGGQFGQEIQFDLGAIGSQSDWTFLQEYQVEIPVFTAIYSNDATFAVSAAGSGKVSTINKDLTVLKNGSHHFVGQAALSINGTMIQDFQSNQNISTHADMMTTFSRDEIDKWGSTLHMSKKAEDYDDFENATLDTVFTAKGVNILDSTKNESFKERVNTQNANATGILSNIGHNAMDGHSLVQTKVSAANTAMAVSAGEYIYVKYDTITVRLKDIVPAVKQIPPIKNIRGYLYLKINAVEVKFTTAAATLGAITVGTITNTAGSFCPVQLYGTNILSTAVGTEACTGAGDFTLQCGPLGKNPSSALTKPKACHVNARLVGPKYEANPAVDAALSMKKTFTYLERRTTQVSLDPSAGNTFNINAGVPNPRFVRVYPFFVGAGDAKKADGTTAIDLPASYNPFNSVKDSAGATTSPLAELTNFNVYVGNKAVFQDSQLFDYEQFTQEVAKLGLNGGMDSMVSTGLLNSTLWSRFYRYYMADVSRRMSSESGNLKSIQVQATNGTLLKLQLIVDTFCERQRTIDTALCEFV